jgi:outer membrane protein TolC
MKYAVLALLLPFLVWAQEAPPLLTRAQALRLGEEGNLALRGAFAQQDAADATRAADFGLLLPGLGLTSTFSRVGPNIPGDPRDNDAISVNPDMQWTNSFTASWSFLNLGALGTWRSESALADAARIHARGQHTQLLATIDLAYHDVVRQQVLLAAQRQEVDLSIARRDIAKAHRAFGVSSALETMQAQLSVDGDSASLLTQESALDLSRRTLNGLLGRDGATAFRVEDSIPVPDPGTLTELQARAREKESGLAEAKAKAEASSAQSSAAGATAIAPVVSAYASYNFLNRWHDDTPPPSVSYQGFVYGLQATWTLFSGGSQTAQWRAAKAQERVARFAQADSALQLERAVGQAWDVWTRSRNALSLGDRDLGLADSTLDLSIAQYKVGTLSGIDLRQAQETALQAKSRYISTRWSARAAALQLRVLADLPPQ